MASVENTLRYVEGTRFILNNESFLRGAMTLVRAARERTRPSSVRLPEYGEDRLQTLAARLFDSSPANPDLEELFLEFWLSKTREDLGSDDAAVTAMLGVDSPESVAKRAIRSTKLGDSAVRKAMWDGGEHTVEASDDSLIRLALALDPAARSVRATWERDVTAPTEQGLQRIVAAKFAVLCDDVYPNGTRTPRLSFGKVSGTAAMDQPIVPFTTLAGLFARATGSNPFRLPQSWLQARGSLDLGTVLDFVSTVDAAPGSSGGPLLRSDGTMVGIQFDGNAYAVGGEYGYDASVDRMIHVSTPVHVIGDRALTRRGARPSDRPVLPFSQARHTPPAPRARAVP